MTDNGTQTLQTAILTSLVKSAPNKPGRTALMKFAYLLQTIRGVPLGYRFRLYNYGPYDDSVLADVRRATNAGLLKSELVYFQAGGYGYEFSTSAELDDSQYSEDIDWVLERFGNETASRLELLSTILFARCDKQRQVEGEDLVNRVHEIKPHFSKQVIEAAITEITDLLECVECRA